MITLSPLSFNTNNRSKIQYVDFAGRTPSFKKLPMPSPIHKVPKSRDPQFLEVSSAVKRAAITAANNKDQSVDDFLRALMGMAPAALSRIAPIKSKTVAIGEDKLTSLVDGRQIFGAYDKVARGAKEFTLLQMFEDQNTKVDGHRWTAEGAEKVPGADIQQKLLDVLEAKSKLFTPQSLLDGHKWYIDSNGRNRHYNNMEMLRYQKGHGIDALPMPRANQGGSNLSHIKLLIADDGKGGKRAVVSGMNWGTHSAANHDFGFLIEEKAGATTGVIDHLIQIFNDNRKFALERLENTPQIAGPLKEEDQKHYNGINKIIKNEDLEWMKIAGDLFSKPEEKHRYSEGKYVIIPCNPSPKCPIRVLTTTPREMANIGVKGQETNWQVLIHELKEKAHKWDAVNFVCSEGEVVNTIIDRHKKGELKSRLVIDPEILKKFPYCRTAYNKMKEAGIEIIELATNKDVNERCHAKIHIFDDSRVMTGSVNTSGQGLNTNLGLGLRDDHQLRGAEIDNDIKEVAKRTEEFENNVKIPPIGDKAVNYAELKTRKSVVAALFHQTNRGKTATLSILRTKSGQTIEVPLSKAELKEKKLIKNAKVEREITFTPNQAPMLARVKEFYGIMMDRRNAKSHYTRGNNELAIYFDSPEMAQHLLKQFDKDVKSSTKKEKFEGMTFPMPTIGADGKISFVMPKKQPETEENK